MKNEDIAGVFERIASLMEIQGEVVFKIRAYQRAAESLRVLGEDINVVHRENRLGDIPGVGAAIAAKIGELLETGQLEFLQKLEEEVPPSLLDLLRVPGVGPKKAALFWKQAGVTTLEQLSAAAQAGTLRGLPGMGDQSVQRIMQGLQSLSQRSDRLLLGTALRHGQVWLEWLRAQAGVLRAEPAGSLRRMKETVGDLDLVIAAQDSAPIMQALSGHSEVGRVVGEGKNKTSVELTNGLRIQLWSQPPESFGALWLYATGSKAHNVRLRELAQKQGLSLSERGFLAADGSFMPMPAEETVYQTLGLDWIPPELREDRGEVEAALEHRLPALLQTSDLLGELHSHSNWSDGALSIREMALAARARGLKTLAITDHSMSLGIANGLTPERLRAQRAEIRQVQTELGDSLLLLQGAEVEIRADGALDYPDEVLAELDLVIASLHSSLRQPREQITARLINAIRNPHVDLIGHPSGRLLPDRPGADLDWEAVFAAAREHGTVLEINASTQRLDLDEVRARRAVELGIPLAINTDAHSPDNFADAALGAAVARRAWVTPEWVINTWPAERLTAWLHQRDR